MRPYYNYNKLIIVLLVLILIFFHLTLNLSYAISSPLGPDFSFPVSEEKTFSIPTNLQESQSLGKRVLNFLPQVFKEAFFVTSNTLKYIWRSYFWPWMEAIWVKIKPPLQKEIKRRESAIKKEPEREILKNLSEKKSFWGKLKGLLKIEIKVEKK